jgi:hypothetical protein
MDSGTAEAWLTTFTTALRAQLPQGKLANCIMDGKNVLIASGQYILTHARESGLEFSGLCLTSSLLSSCCSMVIELVVQLVRFNLPVYRFSPTYYAGGAYLTVNKNVGSLIDWVSWKIMSK